MSYQCKKCGSAVPEDARFCSNCGEKVTALRCPNCGKRLPEDAAFCTYCGAKIAAEQAVPSAPQPETTVSETMVEPFTNLVASPEQDLLSRIEAEPDYTGDLSDVIIKNTQYYLPEFEKARRNEKCRFNWAAFFFNGIFAYYRKSQEVFWHYYK